MTSWEVPSASPEFIRNCHVGRHKSVETSKRSQLTVRALPDPGAQQQHI